MKLNKILILSIILIFFLTVVTVSASDDNQTELSITDETPTLEDTVIEENLEEANNDNIVITANETVEEKKDADFDIDFGDEYADRWSRPDYPSVFVYPKYDDMSGKFAISVDGKTKYNADVNYFQDPYAEIIVDSYDTGKHTLAVKYSGDNNYKPLTKTHIFSIKNAVIYMPDEVYEIGDGIGVDLPAKSKGTVTLSINGKQVSSKTVKALDDYAETAGVSNYVTFNLDKYLKFNETYNVSVTYNVKWYGKTLKETKTSKITQVTYPLEINTQFENEYGMENLIDIYAYKGLSKNNLHAFIDGKEFEIKKLDEEGNLAYYCINTTNVKVGNHTIVINYTGDSKYPSKSVNDTFEVIAKIRTPDEGRFDEGILYNSSGFVNLTLPDDATGNLTVYLGKTNSSYELYKTTELKNGFANIEITGDHIGKYYLKATYEGNYAVENVANEIIDIQPIMKYPTSLYWGQNKYVTVQVDNETTGTLYIEKDGMTYKQAKVINGSAKISLANMAPARYYDSIAFVFNNSDYETAAWGFLFTVRPVMELTATKTSIYYGETSYFSMKVTGYNGKILKDKWIKFKIGKNTIKVKTNSKGIAKLKIPNSVKPGKYNVKVSYRDEFSLYKKLVVKQVLTLKTVKVKKSAKKLVLTATLKKGKKALKNTKVTFKFKGKTYKATTNKKGIAKVTIKKSVLKKLKVGKKVTYQATYLKNTVKKTVKVKK